MVDLLSFYGLGADRECRKHADRRWLPSQEQLPTDSREINLCSSCTRTRVLVQDRMNIIQPLTIKY